MSSLRVYIRQTNRIVAVMALLVSAVLPVLTPSFVAADQVSGRSIALSTSVANASNVTYQVKFTPVQAAGAFVIDLCSDTPLIGAACGTSGGLVVTGADSASAGVTDVTGTGHQIIVTVPMTAGVEVAVDITGIHNPTDAGPLYARILTFTDATGAGDYESETPGTYKDDGGVALSITNNIGVSGAVLETLSFCISGSNSGGTNIAAGCTGTLTPPTLELGELSGTVKALSSGAVSTGSIYTQISTNAVSGAVVRLKSDSAGCGGLSRIGAATIAAGCGILPANTANGYGITAGQAKFGVVTTTATDEGTASGEYQPVASSGYGPTNYALNWAADNLTGVTSPYGDPFLDTDDGPVNNKEMQLTFGASINDSTPAGKYAANLSLIATGKF